MNKLSITCLTLLCLLAVACQEEEMDARIPVDCTTDDCFEQYEPKVKETMILWLESYYQRWAKRSCQPFLGLIDANNPGFTYSCNLPHALLKGRIYFNGKAYYQLDLYYSIRPDWCGKVNGSPSYAGTIYISRHTAKPAARGYYGGYSSFKAISRPRRITYYSTGWYIHHFFESSSTYNHIIKFVESGKWDGFRADEINESNCYTFR